MRRRRLMVFALRVRRRVVPPHHLHVVMLVERCRQHGDLTVRAVVLILMRAVR